MNEQYIKDFNTTLNIYENNYSHEDLINFLNIGDVAQKQAAALSLDNIYNENEAKILINNLTGCDGKIREAVSFRLKEFLPQNPEFYINYDENFLDAIIDINGNICRNTIEAINSLKSFENFTKNFTEKLITKTKSIIPPIKEFDLQDGKYKINKEVFKLYWYLETVSEFIEFITPQAIEEIVTETKNINEYTIREKTAKILSKINHFENIKQELKNDKNYYVRRF